MPSRNRGVFGNDRLRDREEALKVTVELPLWAPHCAPPTEKNMNLAVSARPQLTSIDTRRIFGTSYDDCAGLGYYQRESP